MQLNHMWNQLHIRRWIALITIKDVAQLAGVSKATVSRVLNNSGYVNEATRQKVEAIMKENQYIPSASAVSLSRQETSTIGVLVPEIDNMFYGDVLHGITEVADQNELSLIFFDTQDDGEKEARALRTLSQQRVRGLILSPAVDYSNDAMASNLRKQLNALNIPVVIVDRDSDNMPWDGVFYENYQSSYQAAIELYKAGNRRLGVITGDLKLKIGRDRLEGFRQGVLDCGLKLKDEDIFEGDFLIPRAYELSKAMFRSGDWPQAMYTSNNSTSLGFLKAAHECGIEIGKDIAVFGNDRIDILDMLGIPFSCVYRDNHEMGHVALRMLLERIENPDRPRNICMIPYSVQLSGSEKIRK